MKAFILACVLIAFTPSLSLAAMVNLGDTPIIQSFLATDSIRHIDENRILVVTLQNVKPGVILEGALQVRSMLVQVQLNCMTPGLQAIGRIISFSGLNATGEIITDEPEAEDSFRVSHGDIGLKLWRMVCSL